MTCRAMACSTSSTVATWRWTIRELRLGMSAYGCPRDAGVPPQTSRRGMTPNSLARTIGDLRQAGEGLSSLLGGAQLREPTVEDLEAFVKPGETRRFVALVGLCV